MRSFFFFFGESLHRLSHRKLVKKGKEREEANAFAQEAKFCTVVVVGARAAADAVEEEDGRTYTVCSKVYYVHYVLRTSRVGE